MKILHCLSQIPEKTGSGIYFKNIVSSMEDKGYENAVIYAVQDVDNIKFKENTKIYKVKFLSDKLDFPIAGMSDVMPYKSTVFGNMTEEMIKRYLEEFKKTLLIVKSEFNPDVIITHHIFLLSSLVKEVFKDTKTIVICHGTDIRQIVKHRYFLDKYMKNASLFDMYFSVSARDVENIQKLIGVSKQKIKAIGGGFDQNIFFEKENKEKKKTIDIVYAGKISKEKGVFELLNSIKYVIEYNKNAVFHIIGNIHEKEKQKIDKMNIPKKNIRFVNSLSQKELADYFRNMDIFVLPSYYESLGLVALEALACGLYTVSTNIEGLQKLLGNQINESKVIEYVNLPRLKNVDQPFDEDLDIFEKNIAKKIIVQIKKIENEIKIENNTKNEIQKLSWENIINEIEKNIT